MKSYLDLIPISAKVRRKQNRMTLLCIILAVFLVTVIFGMADMEIRSQRIQTIHDNGNWHFVANVDDEEGEIIAARPEVKASGMYLAVDNTAGYCLNGEEILVMGMDEKPFLDIFTTGIKEGTYPKGEKEAALTYNAAQKYNVSVGDTINLSSPDGHEFSYKVTGLAESTSKLLTGGIGGVILTVDSFRKMVPDNLYVNQYLVQLSPWCNMHKVISQVKEQFGLDDTQTGVFEKLIGLYGQGKSGLIRQIYGAAAVLFVLVLVAGVLMIASSMNSNVAQRTEFFGMMRCLGASRKQIIKFVRREALGWCRTAIPAGALLGCIVVWILCGILKYMSPTYFSSLPLFTISWPSIAVGAGAGLLTVYLSANAPARRAAKVSPLTAVSGNAGTSKPPKRAAAARFAKVDTALGIHHAWAGKKNFFLVSGSFAFSVILFLSFSTAVEFMHHGITPLKPYTADISIAAQDDPIDKELGEKLQENPGVKRVYGRMTASDIPVIWKGEEKKINLVSYEAHQFGWAEDDLVEGEIEEESGAGKVLTVYDPANPMKNGDTLSLKLAGGEQEVQISGVVNYCPFKRTEDAETIICSEELFKSLTGIDDYTDLDVQLVRSAGEDEVEDIRSQVGDRYSFTDRKKSNDEASGAYLSFALCVYGFLVVIALITVISIVNCIAMSVASRIRQYGAMRAIGMNQRQLIKMVLAEAITYACAGCILGCAVGIPVNKWLFDGLVTYHWGTQWTLPVDRILTIVLLVLVSSALAVYGPSKRIKDMSVVETVRAQ